MILIECIAFIDLKVFTIVPDCYMFNFNALQFTIITFSVSHISLELLWMPDFTSAEVLRQDDYNKQM
jgi:hypothetical protein